MPRAADPPDSVQFSVALAVKRPFLIRLSVLLTKLVDPFAVMVLPVASCVGSSEF